MKLASQIREAETFLSICLRCASALFTEPRVQLPRARRRVNGAHFGRQQEEADEYEDLKSSKNWSLPRARHPLHHLLLPRPLRPRTLFCRLQILVTFSSYDFFLDTLLFIWKTHVKKYQILVKECCYQQV